MSWTRSLPFTLLLVAGCASDTPEREDTEQDLADERSCDAVFIPALRVVVTDGVDGPRICDATVTASLEGQEPESLSFEMNPGVECDYASFSPTPGVYDVLVSTSSGKSGRADEVTVAATADGCHALTQRLTIAVE
jgi:hypothetical protein